MYYRKLVTFHTRVTPRSRFAYVWHVVILLTITTIGTHWRVCLIWGTVHRLHWTWILLLGNLRIVLSVCRNKLRLDPGWLVMSSVNWCIGDVVCSGLKGI